MNGRRLRIIVANVGDNPHTRPNITAPNARAMLSLSRDIKKKRLSQGQPEEINKSATVMSISQRERIVKHGKPDYKTGDDAYRSCHRKRVLDGIAEGSCKALPDY